MKQFFVALIISVSIFAQEAQPDDNTQKKKSEREQILTQIFSQLDTPTFDQAIIKARKAGIPEQTVLEARFLHLIDQDDHSALAKLSPELLAFRDKFNLELSEVFGVKEDWLSVIEYTQALAALEKGNTEAFKKHMTEAFWLNPRHAQIYAPHIERLRLDQAMAKLTISPDLSLQPQQGGVATTFGTLSKGKKATILHFWSPMSQESEMNMPDFILTSQECATNNIEVVSVLIGSSKEIIADAEVTRQKNTAKAKCHWIADTGKTSLTTMMRIADIPTMVIISPKGKILFNGHPSESNFWVTIQKIAPKFKRPNTPEHEHADE